MKYLLDTNICIYAIKNRPEHVIKKITSHSPENLAVSVITHAELIYGAYKSQRVEENLEAVSLFLSPFEIIDFGGNDALTYGQIRANLENKGTPIGANDLLIAAQALNKGYILVTNNEKEFKRIDRINIENWAII